MALADPTPVGWHPDRSRAGDGRPRRRAASAAWRFVLLAIVVLRRHPLPGVVDRAQRPGPAGRRDRRDGRRAVRRPAVAAACGAPRPRRRAVAEGRRRRDRRHRRQPTGRPLHRGRGVGQLPRSSAACRRRRSCRNLRGHSSYASLRWRRGSLASTRDCSACCWSATRSTRCGSRLIAEELGLVAYVSPTRTSPVQGGAETAKEIEEAAGIARRTDHRFQAVAVDSPAECRRVTDRGRLLDFGFHGPAPMGNGVIGNTAVSGTVIQGSSPCSPAQAVHFASFEGRPRADLRLVFGWLPSAALVVCWGYEAPSSSGLGHHPLKVAARVRIPLGLPSAAE